MKRQYLENADVRNLCRDTAKHHCWSSRWLWVTDWHINNFSVVLASFSDLLSGIRFLYGKEKRKISKNIRFFYPKFHISPTGFKLFRCRTFRVPYLGYLTHARRSIQSIKFRRIILDDRETSTSSIFDGIQGVAEQTRLHKLHFTVESYLSCFRNVSLAIRRNRL